VRNACGRRERIVVPHPRGAGLFRGRASWAVRPCFAGGALWCRARRSWSGFNESGAAHAVRSACRLVWCARERPARTRRARTIRDHRPCVDDGRSAFARGPKSTRRGVGRYTEGSARAAYARAVGRVRTGDEDALSRHAWGPSDARRRGALVVVPCAGCADNRLSIAASTVAPNSARAAHGGFGGGACTGANGPCRARSIGKTSALIRERGVGADRAG
jgi:hypothetical protein